MGKQQRVQYEKSTKIENFATIMVTDEDHTLGNVVRQQLLKDHRVRFAGYRRPHPLFDEVEIKVQSNGEVEPWKLVEDSCLNVVHQIDAIDASFRQALEQYKHQDYNQMEMGGYVQQRGFVQQQFGQSGSY